MHNRDWTNTGYKNTLKIPNPEGRIRICNVVDTCKLKLIKKKQDHVLHIKIRGL